MGKAGHAPGLLFLGDKLLRELIDGLHDGLNFSAHD